MTTPAPHPATVVWCDAHGTGRYVIAHFRRRFHLAAVPARAELHLFGDTRYRLRVNGTVAGYGPARFAPSHPEHDSVDLVPLLRVGDNEILVEVNHRGAPSFEHAPSSGGFVAWGRAGDIDLATPGAWECRRASAWDAKALSISFAQGPLEDCDTRRLDEGTWAAPVARDRQDAWGPLRPRSIPPLTLREILPERRIGAYALAREWRFGCRIAGEASGGGVRRRAAYACCIHSPREQAVEIALFWGPHWLNGSELACTYDKALGNRQRATLALRTGWNLLYGEPETMLEGWGLLFALPEDRGLTVAASPRRDDPAILRHTASLPEAELAAHRGAVPARWEDLPALEWTLAPRALPPGTSHHGGWDAPAAALTLPDGVADLALPAGDHALVFDLGREWLGHVQLAFDAPAGTVLDIASGERLRPDGLMAQFGVMWMFNEADRITAAGGTQAWEGLNPRGGRWLQVTVRGATGAVRLRRVAVRETVYPLAESGAFACSDPALEWTWRTGAATLRACAEDVFLDCPSRERGLYTFDAVVEHRVARAMSADDRLFRRCLWLYAVNQRPDGHLQDVTPAHKPVTLGDFSMLWVLGLDDWLARSGDRTLIAEVWPHLVRLMESPTWIADGDGLLDTDRIAAAHPTVTVIARVPGLTAVYNALWCMALERASGLAAATGHAAEAARWRARGAAAAAAFRRRLWLAEEGCFAHGITAGKPVGDPFRATVYALALGLADPAQAARCLDYLDRRTATPLAEGEVPPLGPNDSHFMLLACTRHERPDLAERWIRFAYASNRRAGAWTLWEHTTPNASLCHAWSAAPVWWLSEEVLGARWDPAHPEQVLVAPTSAGLTWAEGVVPHPRGAIRIRWEVRDGRLHLAVAAPPGVAVTCRPRGRLAGIPLVAAAA